MKSWRSFSELDASSHDVWIRDAKRDGSCELKCFWPEIVGTKYPDTSVPEA